VIGFLGIGAQKAGTSWLHAHLARHPRIAFPRGKETHYWDWVQEGKRPDDLDWYRRAFAGDGDRVLGDITPAYALLEQRYIRQAHSLNPRLPILFILRNPVERAWSAAQMGLANLQMTREEASDAWFRDVFHSRSSLLRGDYEWTLRNWAEVFGRDRILVLFYEALAVSPRAVLRACADHIGVDAESFDFVTDEDLARRVRQGSGYPLTPALSGELHGLYDDKIRSLSRYLGTDLSHWLVR